MITSIEKSVLISKYKKEGLTYNDVKNRINQLINYTKQKKKAKEVKDFNKEFKKLWNSGI